jgi:hypothetical protein
LNDDLKLNSTRIVSDIEVMFNDSTALNDSVKSMLSLWRERVKIKNSLLEEWEEILIKSKKTIQETINAEDNWFPKINTKSTSSKHIIETYEQTLENLMPQVKVLCCCFFT